MRDIKARNMDHTPLWLFKSPTEKANMIHISRSFGNCLSQSWLLVKAYYIAQPRGLHIP